MDSDSYHTNMTWQLLEYIENCTGVPSQNDTRDKYPLENCTIPSLTDRRQNETFSLYEVPTEIVILLSVFYGTISIVAVIGNFLVIWVISTSRRMQNVTNCFIANLALADIMIGLFVIPFQFQAALLQRWNLPYFMCAFCPFVQVLSVTVSIFTLTAIALDRHRAILNPLRVYPSKYRAKVCIACIWWVSFLIALPIVLAFRVRDVEYKDSKGKINTKPFCDITQPAEAILSYRLIIFLVQYVVPLCIISCVYARIALRLWDSQAPGNAQYIRDATLMKNKVKVIKMLVIVVVIFAFCWAPLQIYMLLQELFPNINQYRYINIVFFCCDWLAMSNSCYNPFIYGIYNENFKREFQQRFSFSRHRWRSSTAGSVDITDKTLIAGRPSVRSTTTTIDWRSSHHQHSTPRNYSYSRHANGHKYFSPLRSNQESDCGKDMYVFQSGQCVVHSASESEFDELCL